MILDSPGKGRIWPFLKSYFIGSPETLRRVVLDIFLWVFLKSQNGSFLSVCAGDNGQTILFCNLFAAKLYQNFNPLHAATSQLFLR